MHGPLLSPLLTPHLLSAIVIWHSRARLEGKGGRPCNAEETGLGEETASTWNTQGGWVGGGGTGKRIEGGDKTFDREHLQLVVTTDWKIRQSLSQRELQFFLYCLSFGGVFLTVFVFIFKDKTRSIGDFPISKYCGCFTSSFRRRSPIEFDEREHRIKLRLFPKKNI